MKISNRKILCTFSSHAITSDISISQMAKAAEFFLSDGVIITGMETGDPPDVSDLKGNFFFPADSCIPKIIINTK